MASRRPCRHLSLPVISYDLKKRIAERRAYQSTPEFKKGSRPRSAIEGTNSRLNRQFGMGRLRVRGTKAARFAVMLKLLGLNIIRTTAIIRKRTSPKG
ncbi:MAG: transposase [Deltaproteobacteria bacterium]|nr:transposase [Deltaproteobacteria bacterium]